MSNLDAFLTMISVSEGTAAIGDRGYNCIVGSRLGRAILFTSYRDHPRIKVQVRDDLPQTLQDESLWSTAAGRYQILARYFDAYKLSLGLPDFSPSSQDLIATQMIRERLALDDVNAGHFDIALAKVRHTWASLPGAGYGQHENSLADLLQTFTSAGGVVA
jgi:muramidase (phage lysozyme)